MTSNRRSRDKPIESVELRIQFKTDRASSRKIREAIPSLKASASGLEARITGNRPEDVEAEAKALLDRIRDIQGLSQT